MDGVGWMRWAGWCGLDGVGWMVWAGCCGLDGASRMTWAGWLDTILLDLPPWEASDAMKTVDKFHFVSKERSCSAALSMDGTSFGRESAKSPRRK